MSQMGRPRKKASHVLRVMVQRPGRGDSKVIWTTTSTSEDIKKKYGDLVLRIDIYKMEGTVYDAERNG